MADSSDSNDSGNVRLLRAEREVSPANSITHTGSFTSRDHDHMSFKKLVQMQINTFNVEEFSDCKVVVKGKEFKVNKYFLCLHSDAFKSYFMHNTKESQDHTINIDDLDESIVEHMLKFLYSGQVDNLSEIAHDLYIVADRYQIEDLKNLCLRYMSKSLNTDTIIKCLELSFLLNLEPLKTHSVSFAIENIYEVRKLDGWVDLTKQNPDISIAVLNGVLDLQQKKKKGSTENDFNHLMTTQMDRRFRAQLNDLQTHCRHLQDELRQLQRQRDELTERVRVYNERQQPRQNEPLNLDVLIDQEVQLLNLDQPIQQQREIRQQIHQNVQQYIQRQAERQAQRQRQVPEQQNQEVQQEVEIQEEQPEPAQQNGIEWEIEVQVPARRGRGRPRRNPIPEAIPEAPPARRRRPNEVIELDE